MKWNNWKTAMFATITLLLLFWLPVTRSLILFILPLGSGLDDLIFFVLLFVACALLLIRTATVRDKLQAIARWLSK